MIQQLRTLRDELQEHAESSEHVVSQSLETIPASFYAGKAEAFAQAVTLLDAILQADMETLARKLATAAAKGVWCTASPVGNILDGGLDRDIAQAEILKVLTGDKSHDNTPQCVENKACDAESA